VARVLKHITDVEKLYTYFEFDGYEYWDDFDAILSILANNMNCRKIKKLDGIYSRYYSLERNDFEFELMYHEDLGNCLRNIEKKDETYYEKLECIAKEVMKYLEIREID
jgi:hypothetical protein